MKAKKARILIDILIYALIAAAVLVFVVIGYIIMTKTDVGALNFIKNLFRFGK